MDFNLTSQQLQIYNDCTLFAERVLLPHLKTVEEDLLARRFLFNKMGEMGLFLLTIPKDQGGGGADTISYILALKAIAKVDAGIAVGMAVTNMVSESVYIFGSDALKRKYLPLIKTGACIPLAFALTEKNAGSDAKAIKAEAHIDPEDEHYYLINGEKQFITNGDMAGAILVMAKTSENPGEITAFMVDGDNPKLQVVKIEKKLGLYTANLTTLRFENLRVPAENILGQKGDGLKIALASLDSGRIGIAAQAIGIAEAAFESAIQFAKERFQFGHAISDNQAIAFKLADMRVKLSASKLLTYKAGWLKDQKELFSEEAAEAKLFSSEACNQITDEALQIHGGYGYIKDYAAEKYFRDGRVTTLYEGTSEIQRIVISRHILNDAFHIDGV